MSQDRYESPEVLAARLAAVQQRSFEIRQANRGANNARQPGSVPTLRLSSHPVYAISQTRMEVDPSVTTVADLTAGFQGIHLGK